jgi:ribonuclease P protein component
LSAEKEGVKLLRKERVKKREDFVRLFNEGFRYHSKQYSLIVGRNNLDYVRLGVSIKKSVGNAAVRNYEKRICREIFRKLKGNFKRGLDVLIIIKQPTGKFQKSRTTLEDLFARALY